MRRGRLTVALVALVLSACARAVGVPTSERVEPGHDPEQRPLRSDEPVETQLSAGGTRFVLTQKARYRVAARVLGTERYYWGWQSRLSPLDLALGWGFMSDARVDRFIDWHQGGRWYFFSYSAESPYLSADISRESSNVHIVPGSSNLRRALLQIAAGDTVELRGALIDARRAHVPTVEWQSSLSRTDTAGGACELMLVEELLHRGLSYR